MSDELHRKKRELEAKRQEVEALEREIADIEKRLAKAKLVNNGPTNLPGRFPVGSTVRLTGKNEKRHLRRKEATVVGHTKCFVKLQLQEETFKRSPENIKRLKDGDQKKKGGRS